MEDDMDVLLRKSIKVLLMQLAARSPNPSADLEAILHEVIEELYSEAREKLDSRRLRLRVVAGGSSEPDPL